MPTIRLATAGDAPAVHAIYAPIVQETAISFEYEIPPVDEIRQRRLRGIRIGGKQDEARGKPQSIIQATGFAEPNLENFWWQDAISS